MRQRIGGWVLALGLAAGTASATQFVNWSFDRVVRESDAVVRGTVRQTWSAWDERGEVIYTYARLEVANYLRGQGPQSIVVREVGGTVAGYTQEAIGFPVLRDGETVVLFLTRWDDGQFRIQAYNQGKFLVVSDRQGNEMLVRDRATQGHARGANGDADLDGAVDAAAFSADEFDMMLAASVRALDVEQDAR